MKSPSLYFEVDFWNLQMLWEHLAHLVTFQ